MLKNDLDAVSKDLDRLSKGNNVELHATFDKFGKTANLQLHDAPPLDGDGEGEKPKNTGLKFWKTPTVRQAIDPYDHINCSIFIKGYYIEVLRSRKPDRWSCSSIYFTWASSPLTLLPWPAIPTVSSYTFLLSHSCTSSTL